jgi:hypothetical protein
MHCVYIVQYSFQTLTLCRDIVPLGMVKSSFNYDTSDMRVLNMENVVRDDDNIKQDMSIDVYGRKQEEEASGDQQQDSGDIDSLLAA